MSIGHISAEDGCNPNGSGPIGDIVRGSESALIEFSGQIYNEIGRNPIEHHSLYQFVPWKKKKLNYDRVNGDHMQKKKRN